MGKVKSKKESGESGIDIKTSTTNLFLNVTIFLLAGLIIYMSYSIYLKLTEREKPDLDASSNGIPSEIIQLEVLNGCGVSGVADRFTDYLRNKDFDVVNVSNYISFDIDESMVIDRIGNKANALKVAKELGISKVNVIQQLNNDYFLDVSLIIGRDYYKLTPLN